MIIEEITVLGFAFATVTRLDAAISQWEPGRRLTFELNGSRIASLYASGQIEAGIAAAEQLVKKQIGRVGETHVDTAAARGTLAMGLFFFNDTATTEIYTLSLHDALPI